MKHFIVSFFATVLIGGAIVIGAISSVDAQSSGYPTRPRFAQVTIDNWIVPKLAYASITQLGTACAIANENFGVASATYASVPGRCNLVLNAGFSSPPSCVATPVYAGSARLAQIECVTPTTCTLALYSDLSTTASNSAAGFMCAGT